MNEQSREIARNKGEIAKKEKELNEEFLSYMERMEGNEAWTRP